jgi:predicted negative regulator of RcsB-dependent stress response
VIRLHDRFLTLLVSAALLAGAAASVQARSRVQYVKADPNQLAPHEIKDLHYGDVLFYFYQDDYFAAITRLLAARQLGRVPNHRDEAELLLGGLYLSLGEHVEAGRIFQELLAGNAPLSVRNRAWYYLGKVWYQRGYLQESEKALGQISGAMDPRLDAERYMLLAQVLMLQGRFDDAISALNTYKGPPDWTAFAKFNLGVALVRKDRLSDATPFLTQVGTLNSASEEMLSLRDKANLALGFALLQGKRPADAKVALQRVRLEGAFSSKALLGVGWADAQLGEYQKALSPWMALHDRNLLDAAVQESYLAVPYAFTKLGANGQAAEYYNTAVESFDAETKRLDDSIALIRDGKLLDRILGEEKKDSVGWFWQLKNLPDAPESRYLYEMLAGNEFQEGLKNYRDLQYMRRNIDGWRDSVAAFDDMITTREKAYAERLPKADSLMQSTDVGALTQKRVDFESRLNEIDKSGDVAALGTPEEQKTWARLKRIEDYLAAHQDDPDMAELREKHRLMKGVLIWRMSEGFKARLWNQRRSIKELEAGLKETQKRALLVEQARKNVPSDASAYGKRVADVRARMDDLQSKLDVASERQNLHLQAIAIETLEAQKQRISTYQVQARFALASIYDRAANPPDPAKKPAPPPADAAPAGDEAAPDASAPDAAAPDAPTPDAPQPEKQP